MTAVTDAVAEDAQRVFDMLTGDGIAELIKADDGAAYIAYGFAMNIVHLANGAITLHGAGQSFATGPLRRSMVEFAVYLRWVADDPDEAVEALNRQLKTNQGKFFQRAKDAGASIAKEVSAIVKSTVEDPHVPKGKKSPNAEGLLTRYDMTRELTIWTADSRLAHPTLTAVRWFVFDSGDAIELHRGPLVEANMEEGIQAFCLWALYCAAYFLNVWLAGAPWTATLADVAARHRFDVYPVEQRA